MDYKRLYKMMYLCRHVEERIAQETIKGNIRLPIHLSIGQEFISAGICMAIDPNDVVFGTYRGHALYLAKGGNLNKLVAEIYGKKTGCCSGKGGSMHLIDRDVNFMGTSGIVGTNIPNAVGYAYSVKYKHQSDVVVCVFGDGAADEGVFCESLNFAALKKLNIIFVCENNFYAIRSAQKSRQALCKITMLAQSLGVPSVVVPSSAEHVYNAVLDAKHNMSHQHGPCLIECQCCRWKEHLGPNDDFGEYRNEQNVDQWRRQDELNKIGFKIDDNDRLKIESEIYEMVECAFLQAVLDEYPTKNDLHSQVCK
jgi:TPP-dependent pyruvate/acetoin dehydrogenase alpha subunit